MLNRLSSLIDRVLSLPPVYRNSTLADQIYSGFAKLGSKNPLQLFQLLKISLVFVLSYLTSPLYCLATFAGIRFTNVDINQIGSVIFLDLLAKEKKLKYGDGYIYLVYGYNSKHINRYFLSLYKDEFVFIWNPLLKFVLAPFFFSPFSKETSFRFCSSSIYGTQIDTYDIWNNFELKIGGSLITMPSIDVETCKRILSEYVDIENIVSVHVRDEGFYSWNSSGTRNAEIRNYEPAFEYLIAQGYSIIRFGDSQMVGVEDMADRLGEKFFDYAHSEIKSEMMDVFLLSHSAFFIGLASGPGVLPSIFKVPTCLINFYNPGLSMHFLPQDQTTFKLLRYKESKDVVPFVSLFQEPFCQNLGLADLDRLGVELVENDPELILKAVKEFIGNLADFNQTDLQKKARAVSSPMAYNSEALGSFSNTILSVFNEL